MLESILSFLVSLIVDLLRFEAITLIWSCLKCSCHNAGGSYLAAFRQNMNPCLWLIFKTLCSNLCFSKFEALFSKSGLYFWHNLHVWDRFLSGHCKEPQLHSEWISLILNSVQQFHEETQTLKHLLSSTRYKCLIKIVHCVCFLIFFLMHNTCCVTPDITAPVSVLITSSLQSIFKQMRGPQYQQVWRTLFYPLYDGSCVFYQIKQLAICT